jgi:hypothetical protein
MTISTPRRAGRVTAAAAIVLMCTGLAGASAPAQAATYDGLSPVGRCDHDARTVKSANLTNSYFGTSSAVIQLRYSPSCRTAWARIINADTYVAGDKDGGRAYITRNSDGKTFSCQVKSGSTCFTAMVNDANVTSYARGTNDPGFAVFSGRTASY